MSTFSILHCRRSRKLLELTANKSEVISQVAKKKVFNMPVETSRKFFPSGIQETFKNRK
jgi:hypothetical protein